MTWIVEWGFRNCSAGKKTNYSGWSMQKFIKSNMYIQNFYQVGGSHVEIPFLI